MTMEDVIQSPHRALSENGTSVGGASYEILELENVNASWQPIYLALFLTLIQSGIFLTIFEWGRRNKYISSVFDRRRTRHPTRTPAPLMKQKGCCNGWLAFEWWRVRISDEDYQKDSWDEFRLLKMEEDHKHQSQPQVLAGEEHDPYMLAAENTCYRESPFFALLEKQHNDLEMGYGDTAAAAAPAPPAPKAKAKPCWRPKPLDVQSSNGGSVISDDKSDDYFSMAEDSSMDDSSFDSQDSYDSDNEGNNRDDGDDDDSCPNNKAHTDTTTASVASTTVVEATTTVTTTRPGTVTIEYDATREMATPERIEPNYGYGDEEPDCGYGHSNITNTNNNKAVQSDYGHGDDDDDNTNPAQPDYGYSEETADASSQPDYGYGEDVIYDDETANASPTRPANDSLPLVGNDQLPPPPPPALALDRQSSNYSSDAKSVDSKDRLTVFTGDISPHRLPKSQHASIDELMGNVVNNLTRAHQTDITSLEDVSHKIQAQTDNKTITSENPKKATPPPVFNLDSIMGNVTGGGGGSNTNHQTFHLDSVMGNVTAPSSRQEETKQQQQLFNLDNIMGNLTTSVTKTEDNNCHRDLRRSTHSVERRSEIEDEIKAVEQKIEKLKRRMSDDQVDLLNEAEDSAEKAIINEEAKEDSEDEAKDDYDTDSDNSGDVEDCVGAGGIERSNSYDLDDGEIQQGSNHARLVRMKQEGDEARPAVRRSRKPSNDALSYVSDEYVHKRSMSLDGSPIKPRAHLGIGGSDHISRSVSADMDYGYDTTGLEALNSDDGGAGGHFERRGGQTFDRRSSGGDQPFNRRSSGGQAYSRRSSGGQPFNRRSSGGHPLNRRSSEGAPFRRKSGDGLKRGMSIGHGDILVDPRATITATSNKMTHFVKNRVLMLNDESTESDDEDETHPHSGFVATKISKRRLTEEDQELLRCIGLDSFMTLRFLRFGFDVSFWPMLLSLVTLIPICKTADNGVDGFFSTTVVALEGGSWRYWLVMIFGILHFGYILRRIWIEWEVFLPLRYEFLENGDFEKEKYKEQYRKTCLVEYIPRAQKHDKSLYDFFDAISPGEVERAEVLLNTEHLRYLIKERMKHLTSYEDAYAQKVHARAHYLRELEEYEQIEDKTKCCCRTIKPPKEPTEPCTIGRQQVSRDPNRKLLDVDITIREGKRVPALKWHYENIQRLNREIEDEYMRLANAQRRPVAHSKEGRLSKWLGIKYLTGSDTGRLHSSTAFVQFKTLSAKQHAIQCNITGMHNYLSVTPVPEVRDIIWDNMHVSRALVETRKAWANVILAGGLVLWSMIVSLIRSFNDLSSIVNSVVETPLTADPAVSAFLDFYAPALIVEGLVRAIPNLMKVGVIFVRFKSHSEKDHYILRWYFGYRLLTFLFIIIGGTLVNSSNEFVQDPINFFQELSGNVALNAQFFISYVIVSGGVQVFFRLSQWHNLALYYLMKSVQKAESMSQRKLQELTTKIQVFHLDEFIPLFIFIFMVGALYGTIAPLSNLFVAGFFYITFKVFKYMTLFVYGNHYEGGGFLFYTISSTLFYVLYMIILLLVFFFSVNGNSGIAGAFSMLLFLNYYVQNDVEQTFVVPSKTLSLAKSRAFDESQDKRSIKERTHEAFMKAKKAYDDAVRKEEMGGSDHSMGERLRLLPRTSSHEYSVDSFHAPESKRRGGRRDTNPNADNDAVQAFNERYNVDDLFEDSDEENPSNKTGKSADFFIYRQPSLNKATWEMAPKPYREGLEREEAANIWGDIRPEQTRKVARQRRASIAMYYGG